MCSINDTSYMMLFLIRIQTLLHYVVKTPKLGVYSSKELIKGGKNIYILYNGQSRSNK